MIDQVPEGFNYEVRQGSVYISWDRGSVWLGHGDSVVAWERRHEGVRTQHVKWLHKESLGLTDAAVRYGFSMYERELA